MLHVCDRFNYYLFLLQKHCMENVTLLGRNGRNSISWRNNNTQIGKRPFLFLIASLSYSIAECWRHDFSENRTDPMGISPFQKKLNYFTVNWYFPLVLDNLWIHPRWYHLHEAIWQYDIFVPTEHLGVMHAFNVCHWHATRKLKACGNVNHELEINDFLDLIPTDSFQTVLWYSNGKNRDSCNYAHLHEKLWWFIPFDRYRVTWQKILRYNV